MKGKYFMHNLRTWTRAFIIDRKDVPLDSYGEWKVSKIDDEELVADLHLHLQSVGKYVKASDLVKYLDDVVYVDGHEREDVVKYRQTVFLPSWMALEPRMRKWANDGVTEETLPLPPGVRPVELWQHDESTFYANDHRKSGWVHVDAGSDPQPKGEGSSIMVSDFVSPDHGWCCSPDSQESAQVIFRAGKVRDGYYTCHNVFKQTSATMDLLEKHYPNLDHIFVFDNATTHLKRPDDALSARHMPKKIQEWGVDVTVTDATGKPVHGPDGKVLKKKVRMTDGRLPDGSPQSLYFPPGHKNAGKFKGMAEILRERGFENAHNLKAQCPGFKCKEGATDCCCRRILFNQPDFVDVPSLLETLCTRRGFGFLVLPKFHCELNFIEQCWGYAKRLYRLYPPTSKDADMEKNVHQALDSIPIECMRRFANRSSRFIDAYHKGLNGKQAAWANKRYRGHCVLPESILKELDDKHIS
ncbi:hypothetical protein BV22DRAFT_1108579 [Leucogyrophana mollusca]|uniref:Uncharacterized protein n=1 Tax=Leucogyrophana mollusca TaxID=85980 RepID=A0ACB8AWR0_9AGAM|nr:hypothetical protein BV22DRAFT_1108579 [Leucogyrophana mollusca]